MSTVVGHVRTTWIMVFTFIAMITVFIAYLLFRSHGPQPNGYVIAVKPDPACNLRAGPCISRLPGGGSVKFAIQPHTIPALEPLQLFVSLDGIAAKHVEVDLSGTDMFMGNNRSSLQRQSGSEYAGESIIPVCTRRAMEWEATVLVDTGKNSYSVPYRFIVTNPGIVY